MTHYGINPSFASGRLPLFANPIRRCRQFQVFTAGGAPMPEASHLDERGYPVADGRFHGLRAFENMGGTLPGIDIVALKAKYPWLNVRSVPGEALFVWAKEWKLPFEPRLPESSGRWHVPSMAALDYFRPKILRTLDWGWQARRQKRPDWSRPRVRAHDLLQGEEMAAELHREAAMLLKCSLWYCVPPRFELSVAEYETRLREILAALYDPNWKQPVILEYGNELWNAGFPVHGWLASGAGAGPTPAGFTWHTAAAHEIATLKRVADEVWGDATDLFGRRPYYLFVGGQLAVPSHLDRILKTLGDLNITPDLAGPALYVAPLKAHVEEWEATGAVPTQDELRASCFARLAETTRAAWRDSGGVDGPLVAHQIVTGTRGVPYFACYEAGQSMISNGRPWKRAAIEAQRSEWLGDLYREIRRIAEAAGVDILNWYSAASDQEPGDARVDPFGLLESCDLSAALPKARAARGE
jgi:hypothetical protein